MYLYMYHTEKHSNTFNKASFAEVSEPKTVHDKVGDYFRIKTEKFNYKE